MPNNEMTCAEIIKELQYLQSKKNEDFGFIQLTPKSRKALNYAIKAVKDQERKANFCPHCGNSLNKV